MFGGLAFMLDGKMCVTVGADRIMCRIDPADHDAAVARPGCTPMVMRGREMRGYVRVGESALRTPAALDRWVRMAVEYNPRALSSAAARGRTRQAPNAMPAGASPPRRRAT